MFLTILIIIIINILFYFHFNSIVFAQKPPIKKPVPPSLTKKPVPPIYHPSSNVTLTISKGFHSTPPKTYQSINPTIDPTGKNWSGTHTGWTYSPSHGLTYYTAPVNIVSVKQSNGTTAYYGSVNSYVNPTPLPPAAVTVLQQNKISITPYVPHTNMNTTNIISMTPTQFTNFSQAAYSPSQTNSFNTNQVISLASVNPLASLNSHTNIPSIINKQGFASINDISGTINSQLLNTSIGTDGSNNYKGVLPWLTINTINTSNPTTSQLTGSFEYVPMYWSRNTQQDTSFWASNNFN